MLVVYSGSLHRPRMTKTAYIRNVPGCNWQLRSRAWTWRELKFQHSSLATKVLIARLPHLKALLYMCSWQAPCRCSFVLHHCLTYHCLIEIKHFKLSKHYERSGATEIKLSTIKGVSKEHVVDACSLSMRL